MGYPSSASFTARYTTQELLSQFPDIEKAKMIISNDAYAKCDILEQQFQNIQQKLEQLRLSVTR